MSYAVAEDGSTLDLVTETDNWAALQAFCDAHTWVQLPPGVWYLSRTLNIKSGFRSLRGHCPDMTTLKRRGTWNGPVVGIGGQGTWTNGYAGAANVTIAAMTVWQTDSSNTNNKCIFTVSGDNLLIEGVRVRGSAYEGIVAGSDIDGVTLRNFEAWDCGVGVPVSFERTTAGINCTNRNLLCEDFVCLRCGQGIEAGNSPAGTYRRGVCIGPGGAYGPSYGVNIGSTGRGVYRLTVEDVVIRGYADSIVVGPNTIGKIAAVTIQGCDTDSGISFAGGKSVNNTPGQPGEGPDTEGSFIQDNTVNVNGSSNGPIIYNAGPSLAYEPYGREHLQVLRNHIFYDGSVQTTPTISFGGKIVGTCLVDGNLMFGLDSAPSRGDVASFTSNTNPAVPGMPNLTVRNNIAYNRAGRSRSFSIKIEGA